MIGRSRVAGSARTSRRISSPLRPGSIKSSTSRSGRDANKRRRPSSPSATAVTRNPARSRLYRTRSRISRSSSMTITKSAMSSAAHARERCEAGQSPLASVSGACPTSSGGLDWPRRRFPTPTEARLERARAMANTSLRKEAESESGITASDLTETWRLLTPEDRFEAFIGPPAAGSGGLLPRSLRARSARARRIDAPGPGSQALVAPTPPPTMPPT